MSHRYGIAICFVCLVLLSLPAAADSITDCNPAVCGIPENFLVTLPFDAIAGDVVLTEPGSATVSDVFRIFNNLVDTGGGTGLGNMAFMFSSDDTSLPDPGTYSLNAVFIMESPSGPTSYLGNGTTYLLGVPQPVPEPQSFELFAFSAAAMAILARRRSRRFQGDL